MKRPVLCRILLRMSNVSGKSVEEIKKMFNNFFPKIAPFMI